MRILSKCLLLLCATLFFSCASTRIDKSWRDPDVSVDTASLKKVLVVALLKDEANRRSAEDKMASLMNGKGIVSYNLLTQNSIKESDEVWKAKLKNDGFDGALVMRLVDVDKEVNYTPGNISTYPVYYRGFHGYWRVGWNSYYTPGSYNTTQNYSIETNVYSFRSDKLIWTGLTTTSNPSKLDKMVAEVTTVVFDKMKKEGFLK